MSLNDSNYLLFFILLSLGIVCYEFFIKIRGLNQIERVLGPKSHKLKNGTLTMGGIIFVFILVIVSFLFLSKTLECLFVTLGFLMFGLIGLLDDLLKVVKKNNDGLNPKLKMLLQVITATILFYLFLCFNGKTYAFGLDLKWIYGLFILFLLVGSSNAFNLTDGIDGLCAGLSIMLLIAFSYIAYKNGYKELILLNVSLIGLLTAFYYFNIPKAYLFMGDVGSLALGAYFALIAIAMDSVLIFAVMAFIFVFETISVILQVLYFKVSKGKRLFKMAPFHHHLEALNMSEKNILALFYIIQLVLIFIGLVIGGYL